MCVDTIVLLHHPYFFSFFNQRTYSFQEESKIKWSGKEWTFIFLKKGYYFLLINRFKSFHDWYEINLLVGDNWTSLYLRWNPLGNWVVLIFSRQKPCTRIISSILHFFSHFSRAINVIISCIIKLRRRGSLYWSPRKRNTNFKSLTFYKMRC